MWSMLKYFSILYAPNCSTTPYYLSVVVFFPQRDDLVTPTEDIVCGAVLSWVKADKKRRKHVMGEILRYVKLPQVT
jgi:hypothetical protein